MKLLINYVTESHFFKLWPLFLVVIFFSCSSKHEKPQSKILLNDFQFLMEGHFLYNMNEFTYPELDTFSFEYKLHYVISGGIEGHMTYSIATKCEENLINSKKFGKCWFRSYRKYALENEFCSLGASGQDRTKNMEFSSKFLQLMELIETHRFFSMTDLSNQRLFGAGGFFILQSKSKGKIEQIYLMPESANDPIFDVLELFEELTPEIKNCNLSKSNFKYKSSFAN